jgi:hemerythrin
MVSATWKESYRVGHPMLDSDHGILIDLLDQLSDAMETGQSLDVIDNVIFVLAEYVQHHFQREEAIMAASGFPELDRHREQHRALEKKVNAIRDRYRAGERSILNQEVVDLLKKWLTEHIMVSDNSYRPWVERTNGDGNSPSPMSERGFGAS